MISSVSSFLKTLFCVACLLLLIYFFFSIHPTHPPKKPKVLGIVGRKNILCRRELIPWLLQVFSTTEVSSPSFNRCCLGAGLCPYILSVLLVKNRIKTSLCTRARILEGSILKAHVSAIVCT